MPTTNTNFTSLITAIDTKAQSLAASTTDPKDLVFLGKAVEALNVADTVSAVIAEGDTQVTTVNTAGTTQVAAVNTAGATQVAAVAAQGSGYASLADPTFTGTMNADNLTMSGNLTVNGTQTILNTATLTVDDLNITVADGAANAAAANGAGLTVDGASATFNYASSGDKWTMNKPLDVTGAVTATGADINGTLGINEVSEKVVTSTLVGGAYDIYCKGSGVVHFTNNQTSNSTVNFSGDGSTTFNNFLETGQSFSIALLYTQGSTAYYPSAIKIDNVTVTPKWQGGSAPTAGNASGIDVYTFSIIKTASATFTVLATVAQFA